MQMLFHITCKLKNYTSKQGLINMTQLQTIRLNWDLNSEINNHVTMSDETFHKSYDDNTAMAV